MSAKKINHGTETDSLLGGGTGEPTLQLKELEKNIASFWRGDYDYDVVKKIGESLREIEGSIARKYESIPKEEQKTMQIGDLGETLEAIGELQSGFQWLWRFPALMVTVLIASVCIPLASSLDEVIVEHPVLGGFPPAISAAAGCIGIQNTAIIIRALGVKLIKSNPLVIFLRYVMISCCLSLGAAITEAIVAWVVVSLYKPPGVVPFSFDMLVTDVPVVIFFCHVCHWQSGRNHRLWGSIARHLDWTSN